jgi:hypothetical protein
MTDASPRCIAFDLEGPLTSQDAAFELMGQVPGGHEVFRAISRYDESRPLRPPDYEPAIRWPSSSPSPAPPIGRGKRRSWPKRRPHPGRA